MSEQPGSNSDRRDPLGFDEVLALLIAFTTVGTILWWSIGRRGEGWMNQGWFASSRTAQVAPTANPSPLTTTPTAIDRPVVIDRPIDRTTTDRTPTTVPLPDSSLPETRGARLPSSTGIAPAVIAPAVVGRTPVAEANPSPTPIPTAPAVPPPIAVPSVSPEAAVGFPDIPPGYWAAPFITALTKRGIISGFDDGTFQPEQPLTRAQYAVMLERVLQEANQTPINFRDLPANFWGTAAVEEAVQSGFLKGYPDATFQPNQPISKMQVLLSLANGFQLPEAANPDAVLQAFQDQEQIPDWAKPAVAAATASGIVVNYPNREQFNPSQPTTRAEVAAMLYQALTTTGQLQPIQSNYIVRP